MNKLEGLSGLKSLEQFRSYSGSGASKTFLSCPRPLDSVSLGSFASLKLTADAGKKLNLSPTSVKINSIDGTRNELYQVAADGNSSSGTFFPLRKEFVFGILRQRRALYLFMITCWLLVVFCWLFFGLYLFPENFAEDTCTALESFQQDPYNNTLSSILPCDELVSTQSDLKEVSAGVYNLVNQKPIVPAELYKDVRDSQLVGMSGYTKEMSNFYQYLGSKVQICRQE